MPQKLMKKYIFRLKIKLKVLKKIGFLKKYLRKNRPN